MQYGDNYGYLQGNHLVVLEPLRAPTQWLYSAPETYQPTPLDPHLIEVAQAHALWPHWAYTHHAHSLPHLLHPSSSFTTSTTLFTDLTSDT